jgi:hypothetical protein
MLRNVFRKYWNHAEEMQHMMVRYSRPPDWRARNPSMTRTVLQRLEVGHVMKAQGTKGMRRLATLVSTSLQCMHIIGKAPPCQAMVLLRGWVS